MVTIISPDMTLARADILLRRNEERALAVMKDRQIMGVISKAHIEKAIQMKNEIGLTPLTVENFMTKLIAICDENIVSQADEYTSQFIENEDLQAVVLTQEGFPSRIILSDEINGLPHDSRLIKSRFK